MCLKVETSHTHNTQQTHNKLRKLWMFKRPFCDFQTLKISKLICSHNDQSESTNYSKRNTIKHYTNQHVESSENHTELFFCNSLNKVHWRNGATGRSPSNTTYLAILRPLKKRAMSWSDDCHGSPRALITVSLSTGSVLLLKKH